MLSLITSNESARTVKNNNSLFTLNKTIIYGYFTREGDLLELIIRYGLLLTRRMTLKHLDIEESF